VDWFLPVGAAARSVEDQLQVLAFDIVYHVFSMSFSYGFTEDEEREFNFVSLGDPAVDGGYSAGYRKYCRFVNKDVPIIGPSRIPYLQPPGVLDWFTAGSISYKKLN
jgi:hypothetical protein